MFGEQKTSGALIGLMRGSNWTMRSIASVVILTFGGLVTAPAVAAVSQEIKEIQWHKGDATNAAKLSAKVEEAHQALNRLSSRGSKELDLKASHAEIRALKADLESLDKGAMDDFAANEAHIKAHQLPEIIEQRQEAAVKTYRDRMDTLMAELKAADDAKDPATFMAHVSKAKAHLDQVQVKPFHEKFDPKNLPFSVAKPSSVKPRLSKKDYQARPVAPPKRAQVAAIGPLAGILTAADVTGALPTNPSDPSYIAPTDDVQITPAIQAQAVALHNNPVEIYNWVHNNVEYIPTYGSIQGSDMTLQTLKGNDFDQASLLIALLRASGIPSRYVYGTIQVPIAQVENWVGGVTDPNAALNLMSQGGIPVTGLVQGGQIKYGQLEHVWVEAWVNFVPSRAAKSGVGNTWISLDASFKQYSYTPGMNLQQAVPLDASGIAQHINTTANIDTADGYVTGIDDAYIQQQLLAYQQQVSNYAQNLGPGVTVDQIVGAKSIVQANGSSLSASLPYLVMSVGTRMTEVPDSKRLKFRLALNDANGNSIIDYSVNSVDLAGKSLALSFRPATEDDNNVISSYFRSASANTASPNLPGYLIDVVPVLALGGEAVATGSGPIALGTQLSDDKGYIKPGESWLPTHKPVVAGEYHVVEFDLQAISNSRLAAVINSLSGVQSALTGTVSSLTTQDFVDATLRAGLISYFAINDNFNTPAATAANVVQVRMPSFGTFHTIAQPIFSFGVATEVELPGVMMDIDQFADNVVSKVGDHSAVINYFRATGPRYSILESTVPEKIFSTPSVPVNGISAAKALVLAMDSGQRIYTITPNNSAVTLPNLQLDADVSQRISDAVAAGNEATVSQGNVSAYGWGGAGYILFDPSTGSGAYEISGHANGSVSILGNFFDILGVFTDTLNDDAVESASNTIGAVGFVVGLADIALTCANNPTAMYQVMLMYTCLTLLQTFFTVSLSTLIGPLAMFIFSSVFTEINNIMITWAEKDKGCQPNKP